ncbi:hypothetical protein EZ456_24715 [Pedobacter psychrodurus]|uniref:Uncharacterized protein n=1 Tax=Pedobacter psychrodurus TaxID=2530456 RepID=A0A4R0PC43_9SPHI|nr:hypothetical protein [Pedobacter psychrodurus]TCD14689.1 hypothetical protein EZ456_24715 [Pedobacter psychrodurus]
MKSFLTLLLIFNLIAALSYCQSKPVQVVFENTKTETATALTATPVYVLKKQVKNADFNYSKLNAIDENTKGTINTKNLMPIFEPISGTFNYYQFLATFKGKAYNGGEATTIKDFHNILIIKTEQNNKIIDAYQYTLEWAEPPLQYDLFKSSVKNILLTDALNIKQLKFKRTYSWNEKDIMLKENGLIKLK